MRSDGSDECYERRRKGRNIENQQEQSRTMKENFCLWHRANDTAEVIENCQYKQ